MEDLYSVKPFSLYEHRYHRIQRTEAKSSQSLAWEHFFTREIFSKVIRKMNTD